MAGGGAHGKYDSNALHGAGKMRRVLQNPRTKGFRRRSCSRRWKSRSWAATTLSQTNRERRMERRRLTGMENAIYYAK